MFHVLLWYSTFPGVPPFLSLAVCTAWRGWAWPRISVLGLFLAFVFAACWLGRHDDAGWVFPFLLHSRPHQVNLCARVGWTGMFQTSAKLTWNLIFCLLLNLQMCFFFRSAVARGRPCCGSEIVFWEPRELGQTLSLPPAESGIYRPARENAVVTSGSWRFRSARTSITARRQGLTQRRGVNTLKARLHRCGESTSVTVCSGRRTQRDS